MKAFLWAVVGAAVLALVYIALTVDWYSDRHYRTHQSIIDATAVVKGCISFRERASSGGRYPTSLDQLTGHEGGEPALVNPELTPGLRYAVIVNEHGQPEAYVWNEWISDGRLRLCGAKGTSDGRVLAFGWPE